MTRPALCTFSLSRASGFLRNISLGLFICLVPFIATMASAEPLSAVVKSVNDFTLDLYLTTAENKGPGQNVLVSPLSAALVTAMVHAGAKGETANEIAKGLHLPSDKTTLEDGFKALHGVLANTPNVTLEIANKIYLEQTKKLKQEFKKTISEVHNSEIQTSDFINNDEKERGTINGWVSKKTHDKINDLIPPGTLSPDTRMVLVNAVYFYGKWKEPFDREQTFDEDFYVSKSKTVKVPMMHLTKNLRYAEIPELKAKAVELCYANKDVCLQIILPDAKDGLEQMQKQLREGAFDLSNIPFYQTKVQLSMPKFKLEETIDIKTIYQKMGIKTMFENNADFSGMIEGNEPLCVSKAIQKTFMDVNEEGTEAAAATAFTVQNRIARPLPRIRAKHPMLVRLVVYNVAGDTNSVLPADRPLPEAVTPDPWDPEDPEGPELADVESHPSTEHAVTLFLASVTTPTLSSALPA